MLIFWLQPLGSRNYLLLVIGLYSSPIFLLEIYWEEIMLFYKQTFLKPNRFKCCMRWPVNRQRNMLYIGPQISSASPISIEFWAFCTYWKRELISSYYLVDAFLIDNFSYFHIFFCAALLTGHQCSAEQICTHTQFMLQDIHEFGTIFQMIIILSIHNA